MDMWKNDKIFIGGGKASYNVPEGYFNDLQTRLAAIPGSTTRNVGAMRRMKPYLALAACFLAIVFVGNLILGNTTGKSATGEEWYNDAAYVALMTMPEEAFQAVLSERDSISDEDVVNYLISSGTSTELIEYTGLIAKK